MTLTWTTVNATSVTFEGGSVSANGSRTVTPSQDASYRLVALGAGGSVHCDATVHIVTPTPPAPVCTLSANPTSITAGGASTLTWTTHNATSVYIDHGVGTVSTSGSRSVAPNVTTTYTLVATGSGGEVHCTATITVVPVTHAPVCTLSANPTSITAGGSSTLTWTTNNATSVSIDQGIGGVATNGSRSVSPGHTTTYTLTATGPGGTVHCNATVTVVNVPAAPVCTLSVSPSSITRGDSSTLTWTTDNATSVSIDQGIGSVSYDGSRSVSPSDTRTYTLTATGSGGTVHCTATVTVHSPSSNGPSCTMDISPSSIYEGDTARLTWDSNHVHRVRINQGIGDVDDQGSRRVSPDDLGTTRYEGTFYGDNGDVITCSATLRVRAHAASPQHLVLDSFSLPGPTPQPLSYVYLSELPYTGLDLGPTGTAMYWLMLILWSLAVAYVVLWGVVPMALRRAGIMGAEVGHAINDHQDTHAVHVDLQHAPAPAPAPVRQSSYEGFKALAQNGELTIDDIVKGLSREAGEDLLPPAHEEPVIAVQHEEVIVAPAAPSIPSAPVAPGAELHEDVPAFLAALLAGDKDRVYGMIRSVTKSGGDAQAFLTHTVFALDDAYRAKVEGAPVHPEVAKVCEDCAPNFLERLIGTLSTAVDSTYSTGVTGVKLAVTRALSLIEG